MAKTAGHYITLKHSIDQPTAQHDQPTAQHAPNQSIPQEAHSAHSASRGNGKSKPEKEFVTEENVRVGRKFKQEESKPWSAADPYRKEGIRRQ